MPFSIIKINKTFLCHGTFKNSPQGGLLMSPLNVLSTRSYKTWPRISVSAKGYKRIVYLEYSGATLATHQGGKSLGLSASSAISRQDQKRSSVRMHSVIPKPYCHHSYQVQFIEHIYVQVAQLNTLQVSRCSAIWRRKFTLQLILWPSSQFWNQVKNLNRLEVRAIQSFSQ